MKGDDIKMSRRDFGKAAAVAAGLGLGIKADAAMAETPVVLTGVARGAGDEATAKAVKDALRAVTDFSWLSRGDSVLIKPVVNSGNAYPATTSPAGLRAVVEVLKDKGAGRVLVCDMSGAQSVELKADGRVRGSTRKLMHHAGLAQAALAAGAELYLPEEDGWSAFIEEAPRTGPSWKGPVTMPAKLAEVDHIVLLPRVSRHLLAGATLGLKAAVGWWRMDTRIEYHRDAATFFEKTAEANTVPSLLDKQRLVLTTATQMFTTFGPDTGYRHEPETGLIIASTSIVAHDTAALAWLLVGRDQTPAAKKKTLRDPHSSPRLVAMINRAGVAYMGGAREAAAVQRLPAHRVDTVWDSRTLRRAAEVLGPAQAKLAVPDGSVPAEVLRALEEKMAMREG
jgi:uncharacterized protein (DUF362 family)